MCGFGQNPFTNHRATQSGKILALWNLFSTYTFIRRTPGNIAVYVDDITLRAFEKYCIENITQRYLQGTFSGYFSAVLYNREYFAYTCKGYDLEHEIFLTRKILSLLRWMCCVSGRKSTSILSASTRLFNNISWHNFATWKRETKKTNWARSRIVS